MMQKIFIIACEPSGDLHGAHLIEEIKKRRPETEFRGLGGPRMVEAGTQISHDMTKISALGLGDVIRQYGTYRKIFYQALAAVEQYKPDAIVLIDSPGFNLRFAKKIKKRFPVIYYVSPQIWAWGKRRIHTIKKTVTKMLAILPFEPAIYEKVGLPCEYVGNPLLDSTNTTADRETLRKRLEIPQDQYAIGLLPGSREKEVKRILPLMLQSARIMQKMIPNTTFYVTHSDNVPHDLYDQILEPYADLKIQRPDQPILDIAAAMDFALITSGTTTLQAALLGTPFFLLYKASWSTYFLGKQLIRVPYLGLVNLLANKRVVPEFIQRDIHPETIAHEAKVVLKNKDLYEKMKKEFLKVKERLGEKGASARAAQAVVDFLKNKSPNTNEALATK